MTEKLDKKLEEKEEEKKRAIASITDVKSGTKIAEREVKKTAKPCWALLMAYLGSFVNGCIMPTMGFTLIKTLSGLTIAQYEGRNALEAVWEWIVVMLSIAFISAMSKTAQQAGFSIVQKNVGSEIRRQLYTSIMEKHIGWHDDRNNASAVIQAKLNHEVNSLSALTCEALAAQIEGYGGILLGLVIAFIYSWPIACAILCVMPLMACGSKVGTSVKMKMHGLVLSQKKQYKDGEILQQDSISNFKTVASIANTGVLIRQYNSFN